MCRCIYIHTYIYIHICIIYINIIYILYIYIYIYIYIDSDISIYNTYNIMHIILLISVILLPNEIKQLIPQLVMKFLRSWPD